VPIHTHTNPRSTPPPAQSAQSPLLHPICSGASLHRQTHTLFLLHKELPPTQASPCRVLISFSTGESSRRSPEAPFQCPPVLRRASANPLTLPRKSRICSISKRINRLLEVFPLPSLTVLSLLRATPTMGRRNPFPGILAFLGQKILYSSHFFPQKNSWLLALCMNQDKVRAMAIYLGLPLWPPLQVLGQKNQFMALSCFMTYYVCVFFLLLLQKKTLPEAMKALQHPESYLTWGRATSRATAGLGDSLKSLLVLSPHQYGHTGPLFPRFISSSCAICVAENPHWVFYHPVLHQQSYWQCTDSRIWEIMSVSWVSLCRLTKTVCRREILSRETYYNLLLSEHWSYLVIKRSGRTHSSHPFP